MVRIFPYNSFNKDIASTIINGFLVCDYIMIIIMRSFYTIL